MSFDVLDEHEQGELVQKWLRENALAIATGVVLGLVLIFGWQKWKVHGVQESMEAAAQYQKLTEAVTAKKTDDVEKVAEILRKEHPKAVYAVFAALQQADIATEKNDLAAAANALDWARDHAADSSLQSLISLRSARVKLAQGDADGAIKLIDALPKTEYVALAAEARGDALHKLGRNDDARAAYVEALAKLQAQAPGRNIVQMKLDDLGGDAAKPVATTVVAEKPAP